jgi:hypothetical protein
VKLEALAEAIEFGVSLSHHGRFVAIACTLADSMADY